MNAVILTQEQFDIIVTRLDELKAEIKNISKPNNEELIDNAKFIQLMKISKRTLQAWRDEGKISFSQIGGKIYYKMKDVQELIDKNYIPASKKKQ